MLYGNTTGFDTLKFALINVGLFSDK